ncbi:histone deacetylase family protein [Marinivivus vitaminiproducens]|uniref:histone deacetylase family protein n=1 Tax=Marinivivus vitaminiproducens TaxID=3035935 RepID=UPI0027A2C0DC|nr:histone deacetylase family protein [Geminicoccaceae bacterium SCSIO 64248]
MKIVHSEGHRAHHPRHFLVRGVRKQSEEVPHRADILAEAAHGAGHAFVASEAHGRGPLAAVHTPDYLDFLQHAHAAWQALEGGSDEIVPNVHPQRHAATYPSHIVGRAGFHMADTACPIGAGTWEGACASADIAAHGARMVMDGERAVYALCRPPGHHAYADMAGGFCFLNNTAIAAELLRGRWPRVAILDIDVHHGNGTQGIFWRRADVLHVSIHADPAAFYPFFWGHAHERGEGPGEGYTMNLPLAHGTADLGYLQALERAFGVIRSYDPGVLVVALGLDASEADPLGALKVTVAGFGQIGSAIARLGLPTLLVQEGGYVSPLLGDTLVSFLAGFESGRA